MPLEDAAYSRTHSKLPFEQILTAARGARRSCLQALRDQHSRLSSRKIAPILPPPRFSVKYCPFAAQLQKDGKKSTFIAKKVRPQDRLDEREICPYCSAQISVAMHSGLPDYRHLLFQAHLAPSVQSCSASATFACTSCYKTFEDSYGFLDHIFQKEIGSERSCQWRPGSTIWPVNPSFATNDPALIQKCLRNCLRREATRARTLQKSKDLKTSLRSSTLSGSTLSGSTLTGSTLSFNRLESIKA